MQDGQRTKFQVRLDLPSDDYRAPVVQASTDVMILVDGVVQRPDTDYYMSGSMLNLYTPPPPDSVVWGMYFEAVTGAAAGQGQGLVPPQPPLDQVDALHHWIPGQGLVWVDARQSMHLVADEAARLALRDPEDLDSGTLAFQQDTGDLWAYGGQLAPGVPLWVKYMPAPPGRTWARARACGSTTTPSGPSLEEVAWVDDRSTMQVVAAQADLNNRTLLPASHLVTGKLVFVESEGLLYQLVADETTLTNTLDDWTPLVSGVTYVGRVGNLPQTAVHGQMFIVRMDMGGGPLNRLVTWRDNGNIDAATVLSGRNANPRRHFGNADGNFPFRAALRRSENDQFYVELAFSDGTVVTRTIQIAVGDTPDGVASKIQTALGQGVPQLTPTVTNNVVTLAPSAGFDIRFVLHTASQPLEARGGWVFVNSENWMKVAPR